MFVFEVGISTDVRELAGFILNRWGAMPISRIATTARLFLRQGGKPRSRRDDAPQTVTTTRDGSLSPNSDLSGIVAHRA